MAISITIRFGSGDKITVEIQDQSVMTVMELKEMISSKQIAQPLSASNIRLVLCGLILSNDEATLLDYNIKNNDVIHVAKISKSIETNTTPSKSQGITGETLAAGLTKTSSLGGFVESILKFITFYR